MAKQDPPNEPGFDLLPPLELRIESLPRRWLSTVIACVTDPKGFGARMRGGTTRWALGFLLLSSLWAAPFLPLALSLAGAYSPKFLKYYLLFAVLQTPIQLFLTANFLSFFLWLSVRLFGERLSYLAALRAAAYTLGVTALAAPVQLLLGVDTGIGITAMLVVLVFSIAVAWRLFNAMARSSGLPVLLSAIAAALPHVAFGAALGTLLFLGFLASQRAGTEPAATPATMLPNFAAGLRHPARTEEQQARAEGPEPERARGTTGELAEQ